MTDKLTPNEALDYFNKRIRLGQCGKSTTQRKAFEAAIEALEKQIPKQPKRIGELDIDSNAEVECECFATQDVAIKTIKRVHCWRCGQLLDWSGEDDELCPHRGKHYEIDYDDYKYCPERGQAIDGREDDE